MAILFLSSLIIHRKFINSLLYLTITHPLSTSFLLNGSWPRNLDRRTRHSGIALHLPHTQNCKPYLSSFMSIIGQSVTKESMKEKNWEVWMAFFMAGGCVFNGGQRTIDKRRVGVASIFRPIFSFHLHFVFQFQIYALASQSVSCFHICIWFNHISSQIWNVLMLLFKFSKISGLHGWLCSLQFRTLFPKSA